MQTPDRAQRGVTAPPRSPLLLRLRPTRYPEPYQRALSATHDKTPGMRVLQPVPDRADAQKQREFPSSCEHTAAG